MSSRVTLLQQAKTLHTYRTLPSSSSAPCILNGNDYLGLSKHEPMLTTLKNALTTYGLGATGSRLLSGNAGAATALETTLAAFLGTSHTLLFNSGYQLNAGVIPTLVGPQDIVFSDKYCHASIIDGIRLSGAAHKRFAHNDLSHLVQRLTTYRSIHKRCLIISESLFSMDGDSPDLAALHTISKQFNAALYIDEAHAFGILGPAGRGLCAQAGITPDFLVGTFGKACGGSGAFIGCDTVHYEWLINHCRSFIYSTALPPALLTAMHWVITHLPSFDAQRDRIQTLSRYYRDQLAKLGFPLVGAQHILALIIGSNAAVLAMQNALLKQGIACAAIRHPTVPKKTERLRFSLTPLLTKANCTTLIETLKPYAQHLQ